MLEMIKRIDPIGSLLSMCAVICLLLALRWGGNEYDWNNGRIIVLLVLFGILLVAFLYMQWRQGENATVPPRLMSDRTVYASCLYAFGIGSSSFVLAYYLPVWFQAVQEVPAFDSGIRTLPLLLTVAIAAILGGALVTALGYYAPIMLLGTVLMSVGAGLLTTLTPDATMGHWIGYQAIYGIGVGLGIQQPMIAVQTALDIKDIPTASCMIIFFQTMGGAIFISVGMFFHFSLAREPSPGKKRNKGIWNGHVANPFFFVRQPNPFSRTNCPCPFGRTSRTSMPALSWRRARPTFARSFRRRSWTA